MRIITYSDLHLEFGTGWMLPPAMNGDVMIPAGDIVKLTDYESLDKILRKWKNPVLYLKPRILHAVADERRGHRFKAWLGDYKSSAGSGPSLT